MRWDLFTDISVDIRKKGALCFVFKYTLNVWWLTMCGHSAQVKPGHVSWLWAAARTWHWNGGLQLHSPQLRRTFEASTTELAFSQMYAPSHVVLLLNTNWTLPSLNCIFWLIWTKIDGKLLNAHTFHQFQNSTCSHTGGNTPASDAVLFYRGARVPCYSNSKSNC